MAVNAMQITDIYQILNSIHNQATGKVALAPTNTAEFVSQATATLAAGTDAVYNALMDVSMRPIFAVRDYTEKFKGLYKSDEEWGAIRRKISYADRDINEDAIKTWQPVDGDSADQWVIKKEDILEMRFYGSAVYEDHFTVFENQLKTAFSSPDQLGSFVSNQVTHNNNQYKQYRENLSRATLANFIGAKVYLNNGIVHLLTEYNAETGLSLTAQTVYQPGNMEPFFRWVRAKINTLGRMMGERSSEYQFAVNGKNINRHTGPQYLKMYIDSASLDKIDAMVNTTTYHDEPLAYADVEGVNFWQSIKSPHEINVTPSYTAADGTVKTAASQNVQNIFGVMFDQDAIGINQYFYGVRNTPVNARRLYYNTWLHARMQYMNDLTEKGIVLLLD
jgi:hypothetical protein